jgi:peptidyl-prolyl cis-trans isomerase SurA
MNVHAQEKLLDKIVAVINTRVVSLSELDRMEETLHARRELSPLVFTEAKYDKKALLQTVIQSYIVRDKIGAQGYVITDDQVEGRIKMTEERVGFKRSDLLAYLKSKGVTFEEYFEIIRETMEYNIFASRIIGPLISVTEQEVKNEFYKRNTSNKALSFKYNLIDFTLPDTELISKDDTALVSVLKDYQLTGRIPEAYKDMETNKLEQISEEGLNADMSAALKAASEGSFAKPVRIGGVVHVLYIEKKDLVESQQYLQFKDRLEQEIMMEKGKSVSKNWFDREYNNYYIKNYL